jgi:hypothetical protein
MAVSMHYGPPKDEETMQRMNDSKLASMASLTLTSNNNEVEDDDFFDNAAKISSKMRERNTERNVIHSSASLVEGTESTMEEEKKDEETSSFTHTPDNTPDNSQKKQQVQQQNYLYFDHEALGSPRDHDSSNNTFSTTTTEEETDSSAEASDNQQKSSSRRSFASWVGRKKKAFLNANRKLKTDPLEGQIDLDNKPLVLCQEIYDRIIGNHQTSTLTKEKAIKLLREDLQQHVKENGEEDDNDAFLQEEKEMFEQLQKTEDIVVASDDVSRKEDATRDLASENEEETMNCTNDAVEKEEPLIGKMNITQLYCITIGFRSNSDMRFTNLLFSSFALGYWLWENSIRTHKMKMHVAKGSDLALHVALAIIVNQVRYERNAAFAISM